MTVFVQRPDAVLNYTFQWGDDIPQGISLVSVSYTHSTDLTVNSATLSVEDQTSTILLSGAVHGRTYPVNALARLSNGEYIPGEATLRAYA
jgi:hypothetical protein